MVSGRETPSRTNCELLLACDDRVTLAPDALIVSDRVCVVPTGTSPKLSEAGATVSFPVLEVAAPASPVPMRSKSRVELEALLVAVDFASLHPAAVGWNLTLTAMLLRAARVNGNVN